MNEASDEIHQDVPQPPTNDLDHLDSSGWWFASAGFPMIAATLGPRCLCVQHPRPRQTVAPGLPTRH